MKTQQQEQDVKNIQQQHPKKTSEEERGDKNEDSNVHDFVNEIKNTAMMNTFEQAGFIYEPTSGLYW